MRNMFPINSNLGAARPNLSGRDPMQEVIQEYRNLVSQSQPQNGMQQVTAMQRSPVQQEPEPLKFGGMIGNNSNPGADILDRSKRSAEQTYANYGKPRNTPNVSGPSNDEQHLEAYFKRKNAETVANATAANAGNKGWKVGNVIDPATGQSTSIRYNEGTGETAPLDTTGPLANKESPANVQKRIDTGNKEAAGRKAYLDKTNESLTVIKDLMDDNGELTTEGARAVGKSSIGNFIPTTLGYSGSLKIQKLKGEQVLNLIKELKQQSSTGATGMGNMSNKDLGVIERAATLLDTGLDEAEFKKQLGIVKAELNDIAQRLSSGNTGGMNMAVGHSAGNNTNTGTGGKIRVRDKATGRAGTMSESKFDPQKYDRVQ